MTQFNHEWLPVLTDLTERGVPCVLITVMEAKGSTPRESGTKMVVTQSEQFGTIGGGNLEFQAIEEARKILTAAAGKNEIRDYPLGPSLAQCCGGMVSVFLEPFLPVHKTLLLFGAGHVGREVVRVLDGLPLKIKWIDERADEFPTVTPKNCEKIVASSPVAALRDSPDDAFIVVMTYSHDLDFDLVEAALNRGSYSYLGLIGSKTKRVKFEKRLLASGIAQENLSRLTCPIGIGGVTGKHPREIAIALAAELLSRGLTRAVPVNQE